MNVSKLKMGLLGALAATVLLGAAGSARAHVLLTAPNGGESLEAGEVFTITWQVQIAHSLQDWDLWYSRTDPGGEWIVIAFDLPPGTGTAGSVHTYDWTVPDIESNQVRIRVRQDNAGADYEDVSDRYFTIQPSVPVRRSTWGKIKALYE